MAKMNGPCVIWGRAINHAGYGVFRRNGKNVLAHRASYEDRFGPIPSGMFVCHHCDVRACTNTEHLFLGTAKDNNHDMMAKGRARFTGPKKCTSFRPWHTAKLGELTVQRIKIAGSLFSPSAIAKMMNLNRKNVSAILRGKSWAGLGLKQALT